MVCLKTRHVVNITRTPLASAPSLPIPDTTYPKKRTTISSQKPTLQTPSSPKHPGTDTREVPLHQKSHEITVEHAHKGLLPPTSPEHDTTLCVLFGSIRHESSTSVSSTHRRHHGVGRGQSLTDPSPCLRWENRAGVRSHPVLNTLVTLFISPSFTRNFFRGKILFQEKLT